jgi:hypothetical protein
LIGGAAVENTHVRPTRPEILLLPREVHGRYAGMQKHGSAVRVLLLCVGLFGQPALAKDLTERCPIDWRAVPLAQAVRELADRLEVAYILDASVSEEMMAKPVRLTARHLSGRQAFRWTARSAGLDAVVVDGVVMIGQAERFPRVWRLAGEISGGPNAGSVPHSGLADSPDGMSRWREVCSRRVDLTWADAPLSRVAKDTSERFGMDLVFHPQILEDQPLVRLEGEGLDWNAVGKALAEQLDAVSEYDDGVIRVEPRGTAASRPAPPPSGSGAAALAPRDNSSVLFRPVEMAFAGGSGQRLGETLRSAVGINCRVEVPGDARVGAISVRGGLLEFLEAARILDGWEWKITGGSESDGPILLIRAGGSGRSVP